MSERGMILALQRIHDDPGFTDRVAEDPENTLGLYDLADEECNTLIQAIKPRAGENIRGVASGVGIDGPADHMGGGGAKNEGAEIREATQAKIKNSPNAITNGTTHP